MDKYNSDARASIGGMRGGRGRRGMPVQKAKDFRGTVRMLWDYMGNLKWYLFLIIVIFQRGLDKHHKAIIMPTRFSLMRNCAFSQFK